MNKSDITTPLLNIINEAVRKDQSLGHHYNNFLEKQVLDNLKIRPSHLSSKEWHKQKLGKQKYCWMGFVKHWVWESDTWRVYVSSEGAAFEVLNTLTAEQAVDAWNDYYSKVKND